MRTQNLLHVFLGIFAALFIGLASPTAEARYYSGHYSVGYGHHGYRHGGHIGFHHGHRSYRGYPYRYQRKHHAYGYRHRNYYRKPYYYGGHYRHRSSYRQHHGGHGKSLLYGILSAPAYLAYGILKTPAVIVENLSGSGGSRYRHSDNSHKHDTEDRRQESEKHSDTKYDSQAKARDDNTAEGLITKTDTAWLMLEQGEFRRARHQFGLQAANQPEEGIHKIGYALAAAGNGDLDRGSWAMKRALRYDVDAFHYMDMSASMSDLLHQLISEYQSLGREDSIVTLAMLHYLAGNKEQAKAIVIESETQISDRQMLNNLNRLFNLDA